MKLEAGGIRLSASDLSNFIRCKHLTALDLAEAHGLAGLPHKAPRFAKIDDLVERGKKHEAAVLAALKAKHGAAEVAEIPDQKAVPDPKARAQLTREAVEAGKSVIYQGVLLSGDQYGAPDFLVRARLLKQEEDEDAYAVIDAKLARSAKATAVLQTAFYSRLFTEIYGPRARWMYLQLGDGEDPLPLRVEDCDAYEAATLDRLREVLATPATTLPILDPYPEKVEHCQICDWRQACDVRRRADDDLSLVAGATLRQRRLLKSAEIATRASLANTPAGTVVQDMEPVTLERLRLQAAAQLKTTNPQRPYCELADDRDSLQRQLENAQRYHSTGNESREPLRGFFALPAPDDGDVFFDLEASRFFGGGLEGYGLEYLFGYVLRRDDDTWGYERIWAFDLHDERAAFESFIGFLTERFEKYPNMHVYHYNHYEPTALGRLSDRHGTMAETLGALMGRYGAKEDEVDALLRGRIFVDLYPIFRQAIRAGIENYSLKSTEKVAGYRRKHPLDAATDALIAFEARLEEGPGVAVADTGTQADIEAYNREDCEATRQLRDWLECRRSGLETSLGRPIPRPPVPVATADKAPTPVVLLRNQLKAPLGDADDVNRALLADLLEYQWRDRKPGWWEYFHVRGLDDDGLLRSRRAVTHLNVVGPASGAGVLRTYGVRSPRPVYEFKFPPQEHSFDEGDDVFDPARYGVATIGKDGPAWKVIEVDDRAGRLFVAPPSKGFDPAADAFPTALVADGPRFRLTPTEQLRRYGEAVMAAAGDLAVIPLSAALIRRTPPPLPQALIDAGPGSNSAGAVAAAIGLAGGCLAIQGPPGTGKTYTGAEIVAQLLRGNEDLRIGIMGPSHKAITGFLEELEQRRSDHGATFRAAQYISEASRTASQQPWSDGSDLDLKSPTEALAALAKGRKDGGIDVLGGTAWLWSHEDAVRSVDTLIIDEAGQVPLAFAVAAAAAAKTRIILLGDPQQLAQVTQGSHPDGAGNSVLDHLLAGEPVIPAERGLFLSETRRMHDSITDLVSRAFYRGQLSVDASLGLDRQAVGGAPGDWLTGSGMRLGDVIHLGNGSSSPEEAARVVDIVEDLLGRQWTDRQGVTSSLVAAQIRVVTPYNSQIRAISRALTDRGLIGIEVGTVDKFQGQEAAVIVYSMATSTAEEAPRGMEFLYQLNRLNVAISRAKAMAIVVMSPELVRVDCSTPRQMQLASAHCLMRARSVPA